MPLLARMLAAPLFIEVRAGAVADLGALLAEQRIAREGRMAVVVGPGQGDSVCADLQLAAAKVYRAEQGTYEAAVELGQELRAGTFEAVAGIGGGRTIDVTKFAAHMAGIPMVAVATSLAHDGICSPMSTLQHESGPGSYGVVMPTAVLVDLDRVRQAPVALSTAGIGDAVSNLSAVADWELAVADVGEQMDGLAAEISACLARHGLPRLPRDLGLSDAEFVQAVAFAPETRPGRYTILERLALPEDEIAGRVAEYVTRFSG